MIEAPITLLKASLSFALLYGAYHLLLHRLTLLHLNRLILLSLPALALFSALPMIKANMPLIAQVELMHITVGAADGAMTASGMAPWRIILLIYMLGMFIASAVLVRDLVQATKALRDPQGSFTFWRCIRLSNDLGDEAREVIQLHEQAHADGLHTLDLIYYRLVRVVFWYDPFLWMAERRLREVHEYIADRTADQHHANYPQALLAHRLGVPRAVLVHAFDDNQLKQRMNMMMRRPTTKTSKFRYLLLIPVLMLGLTASSWTVIGPSTSEVTLPGKADKKPEFKGGMDGLVKFMTTNLNYPKEAKKKELEGTVQVAFTVLASGDVDKGSLKVKKSVDPLLDKEAMRVIRMMPAWTPGTKDGKKVPVEMVLPVKFVIPH